MTVINSWCEENFENLPMNIRIKNQSLYNKICDLLGRTVQVGLGSYIGGKKQDEPFIVLQITDKEVKEIISNKLSDNWALFGSSEELVIDDIICVVSPEPTKI